MPDLLYVYVVCALARQRTAKVTSACLERFHDPTNGRDQHDGLITDWDPRPGGCIFILLERTVNMSLDSAFCMWE